MAKYTREQSIDLVIDGLTSLIMASATSCASEQYSPRSSPDDSDDYIRERKEWVKKLRNMREDFEALVTGFSE